MAGKKRTSLSDAAVLVPMSKEQFFGDLREVIRQELAALLAGKGDVRKVEGLTGMPLYDMDAVRQLFGNVSRSTIYKWIDAGLLKPRKLRGKVYFMAADIERLLESKVS